MRQINTNEIWELQPDGSSILIKSEEIEVDVKTPEEEIAEKEDELLKMFNQLQELKNKLQ